MNGFGLCVVLQFGFFWFVEKRVIFFGGYVVCVDVFMVVFFDLFIAFLFWFLLVFFSYSGSAFLFLCGFLILVL